MSLSWVVQKSIIGVEKTQTLLILKLNILRYFLCALKHQTHHNTQLTFKILQTKIRSLIQKKKTVLVICLLWLSSIIFSLPSISYTTYKLEYNSESNTTLIVCYMDRSSLVYKSYFTSFYFMFIFIPSIIMSVVYLIIIRKLKKLNKFVFSSESVITRRRFNSGHNSVRLSGDESANKNSYSMKDKYFADKEQELKIKMYNENKEEICELGNAISKRSTNSKSINNDENSNTNNNVSNALKISEKPLFVSGMSLNDMHDLKYHNRNSKVKFNMESRTKSVVAKRKLTITLCLISIAFFFCQLPIRCFQIFNIFYEFESSNVEENDYIKFKILNIIFLFTKLLYFLHGMSNPIIYNLMSTKFRKSFKRVIFCRIFLGHMFKKRREPKFSSPLFD